MSVKEKKVRSRSVDAYKKVSKRIQKRFLFHMSKSIAFTVKTL